MEVLLAACCVGALQGSVVWWEEYFGQVANVATDGNTAYVAASTSGVLVVDVTNPASPTLLGACEGCGKAKGVRFYESMLYTVNEIKEVVISDATNPRALSTVGRFECPATGYGCFDLVVAGGKVYFPDQYADQVFIVDATNPAAPNLVGTYDAANPNALDASGQYLYVASDAGLEVVDVTDPAAPTRVGLFANDFVLAMLVSGNLVYSSCDDPSALCVVDVTDPTSPTRVGSVGTACGVSTLTLSGTMLYAACETGFQDVLIIDVSSAASPSVVGQVASNDPFGGPKVASTGTTVPAACRKGMLQVIDASVPTAPSSVVFGTLGSANSVHVAGTVAVVSDNKNDTIRLYDVSNPSAAALLSTLDMNEPVNVFILGTHVYVCVPTGLNIVDITNPSAPSLVGNRTISRAPNAVWVVGQTAYVTSSSGIDTLDVSNPLLPSELGSIDLGTHSYDVTVVGTTAYVAGGSPGLFLVDVGNPSDMKLLGSVTTIEAYMVAVSGTVAYVAGFTDGLQVVDVSDPAAPAVLGYYDDKGAFGVSVVGETAYVVDLPGLYIYDVSDPTTPVLVDTVDVNGNGRSVYAVGTTVYMAADGLRIVEVGEAPVTPVPTTAEPTPTGTPVMTPVPTGAAMPGPTSGVTTPAPGAPAMTPAPTPAPTTAELTPTVAPVTTPAPGAATPGPTPAPTQDGETLTPTTVPTPSPEGDDVAYWVWILVTLGVLGVLGGAAAVYFSRKQKAINMSEFNNYHNEGLVQGQGMEGVKDTPGRATVMTI